jgi:hypothetical protein
VDLGVSWRHFAGYGPRELPLRRDDVQGQLNRCRGKNPRKPDPQVDQDDQTNGDIGEDGDELFGAHMFVQSTI